MSKSSRPDPIANMLNKRRAADVQEFTPGEVERLMHELAALQQRTATQQEIIDSLQTQSLACPVTGLANARTLESELNKSLSTAKRYGRRHGLLRIDVADFEGFAALGEETAAAVLKHTASLIRQNIRATDIAARTEGNRFCVILNELRALENAEMRVTEVSKTIAQTPCVTPKYTLQVSVAAAAFIFGADDDMADILSKTTTSITSAPNQQ